MTKTEINLYLHCMVKLRFRGSHNKNKTETNSICFCVFDIDICVEEKNILFKFDGQENMRGEQRKKSWFIYCADC